MENEKGGCEHCGRNHEVKNCPMVTGACFWCGEMGHQIANCSQKAPPEAAAEKSKEEGEGPNPSPKTQGRLYHTTREEANNASDVVRGDRKSVV